PLRDPESLIRRRNLGKLSSLFDFEEVINNNHNQEPPSQKNNGQPPMVRPNGQAPRTMEELCRSSINGRGRPIASIPIQATDFGLRHHMIQQVQNTCQFHELPGDDANRHIDKFLEITQHMKQNESSGTINAVAGGTFMQKIPEECYELIENMTAHHNHWDTSVIRDETSRNISSTSTTKIPKVVRQLEMMNKNFSKMMRQFQTVKAIDTKCKTCGGPHSFTECPAIGGYTQETAYATMGNYNSGSNSYQPQGGRNLLSYRSNNYLRPPGFNQPNVQNRYNQNQNQSYTQNQGNNQGNYQNRGSNYNQGNNQNQLFNENQGRKNNFNQAPTYEALTHQPQIELKNMFGQFMKMNTASSSGMGSLPSNTVPNPQEDLKAITTQSGVTLTGPSVSPPPFKEPSPTSTSFSTISSSKMLEVRKDMVQPKKAFFARTYFTQRILELADRSMTRLADIAEDIFVKVGKFHFLIDFVVNDYVVDPYAPLILERPFLRTGRALIDVYWEELTLRVDDEAITFKVGQTSKYSYNDAESINRVDVIDVACEEYVQEEKCHFMVKEGIILDHKISKSGIEVDRAKVDFISKLPHSTSVKGAENLAADHLSRLENPHQDELEKKEITKTFPLETLGMVAFRGDSSTSWIAPDLEDSRARGFTNRPLELQSLAYRNPIS
nr:reverse transcriptase domain-containing protein [Tanacetum cinerariifolium]